MYKILDLFGNEETVIIANKKKAKKNLFTDYDEFVDKFEAKKTTDDCYTPKEIMDIVVEYVDQHYPLKDKKIIRPFFPNGDYKSVEHEDDHVVIDNPPFSIISKICRYYIENNVKFFLFCPHLTAFSLDIDVTHIIASADIQYENGAVIKTAFVSNLFNDVKIIGASDLYLKFKAIQEKNKVKLPKYEYPENILTVSRVAYCVEKGVSMQVDKKDVKHHRGLDAQKKHKKAMFGSAFLLSDSAAQAAAQAANKKKDDNVIVWELSERERKIIESLG